MVVVVRPALAYNPGDERERARNTVADGTYIIRAPFARILQSLYRVTGVAVRKNAAGNNAS